MVIGERGVDRFPGVRQDVPQQEQQYTDGARVEQRAQSWGGRSEPADGQAEEDGQASDCAEECYAGWGHGIAPGPGTGSRA
ncbi:hypothetical protein KRMM14A1259_01770 [Krasilnikovia sp. MM14-A1259]